MLLLYADSKTPSLTLNRLTDLVLARGVGYSRYHLTRSGIQLLVKPPKLTPPRGKRSEVLVVPA